MQATSSGLGIPDAFPVVESMLPCLLKDLGYFQTPRVGAEAAEGFLPGAGLLAIDGGGQGEPLKDFDLPVGKVLDKLTKIRIGDP